MAKPAIKKPSVQQVKEMQQLPNTPIVKPTIVNNGVNYRLTQEYNASGILIPKNYLLKECTDGWFQVFDLSGYRFFVRLSPEIVNGIKYKN